MMSTAGTGDKKVFFKSVNESNHQKLEEEQPSICRIGDMSTTNNKIALHTQGLIDIGKQCATENPSQLNSGIAALKIIELSKKIRELSAELTKERAKCRNLAEQLRSTLAQNKLNVSAAEQLESRTLPEGLVRRVEENEELKNVNSKLQRVVTVFKEQISTLKWEIKTAKKVLELETGLTIPNLGIWLRSFNSQREHEDMAIADKNPAWRGRQQQILLLKAKVKALEEKLLRFSTRNPTEKKEDEELLKEPEYELSGATYLDLADICFPLTETCCETTNNVPDAKDNNTTSKKRSNPSVIYALEKDNEFLKVENTMLKTRVTNLKKQESNMCKNVSEMKEQMQCLLQKGTHDDELIQSLVKKHEKLKTEIADCTVNLKTKSEEIIKKNDEISSLKAQHQDTLKRYEEIVKQKEEAVQQLGRQLAQLRTNTKHLESSNTCILHNDETSLHFADSYADKENASVEKQLALVLIERDGLRRLVQSLREEQEKLLERIQQLENESAGYSRQLGNKIPSARSTKTSGSSQLASSVDSKNGMDGQTQLSSQEYLQKTISGLSVSAAKFVSKRMRCLQEAIIRSEDELSSMRSMVTKLKDARKEDFAILSQIVEQLRTSCSEEKCT
ncbi:unnamed protein product [Dicrocoelium dendriticum]|nr:unnamed protein product [Dicrocoelium dendriticum]